MVGRFSSLITPSFCRERIYGEWFRPPKLRARPTASGAKLPFYHVAHEYDVALLFVGALVAFCVSLIELGREARLALHDNDLRK